MAAAATVEAFDREAAHYDARFVRNPVALLWRQVVQDRLEALFRRGSRVLDLGCGTGEDARVLASRGVDVTGLDVSPAMVERARALCAGEGRAVRFEVLPAERADELGTGFDGAYSNFGALNCADRPAVGRALSRALRPGAPVVFVLVGAHPLPATLRHALTARDDLRPRREPTVGGRPVDATYPGLAALRTSFGPGLTWTHASALGVLVPPPDAAGWVSAHPQAYGLLALLERAVRGWPLLRALGDHVVLEGVRR